MPNDTINATGPDMDLANTLHRLDQRFLRAMVDAAFDGPFGVTLQDTPMDLRDRVATALGLSV